MSDIVERLRAVRDKYVDRDGVTGSVLRDAATEIERLRAERDEYERQAIEAAQKWMAERALADELGQALKPNVSAHATTCVCVYCEARLSALAKWREARK